jgi:hypothetical protein
MTVEGPRHIYGPEIAKLSPVLLAPTAPECIPKPMRYKSNRTVTEHRAVGRYSSLPLSLVRWQENTLPASTDKPSILSPPCETTKAILSGGAGCPLIVWV